YHFLAATWARYLRLVGVQSSITMRRAGFYPRGGGEIHAHIQPARSVLPVHVPATEVSIAKVTGFSAVAGLPNDIAKRQARRAKFRLKQAQLQAEIRLESWQGGPSTVIALELPTQPVPTLFFGVGERGKPAERVADEAANEVLAYMAAGGIGVDHHSADQILVPLALADGPSSFRTNCVTQHLLTNIEVVRRFIDREIKCEGAEGEAGVVSIG